jgi:hypothetical protein
MLGLYSWPVDGSRGEVPGKRTPVMMVIIIIIIIIIIIRQPPNDQLLIQHRYSYVKLQ